MRGWILLERVEEIIKGKSARAVTQIPETEYGLEVLMTEMTAQLGGLLVGAEADYKKDVVLAKIESANIHAIPCSGTSISVEVEVDGILSEHGGWLLGKISDNSRVFCETKIMLTIVGVLMPEAEGLVTFPENHLKKHQIREKIKA